MPLLGDARGRLSLARLRVTKIGTRNSDSWHCPKDSLRGPMPRARVSPRILPETLSKACRSVIVAAVQSSPPSEWSHPGARTSVEVQPTPSTATKRIRLCPWDALRLPKGSDPGVRNNRPILPSIETLGYVLRT